MNVKSIIRLLGFILIIAGIALVFYSIGNPANTLQNALNYAESGVVVVFVGLIALLFSMFSRKSDSGLPQPKDSNTPFG